MPAQKHDFTATEIKAGIFVLASLVVLIGFIATIRGCRPRDEDAKTFYVTFTNIGGLNRGADVRFGGVKAGRVVAIKPDPDDRSRIRVTAVVRGDVPVNQASRASVEQVTLTTEKHLEISTGDADAALLESGDTVISRTGGGLMGMPDLEGVATRLEKVLDGVVALLGVERAREKADGGEPDLTDLNQILASLDQTLVESTGTVRELHEVIGENRADLREIVVKLIALEETATELLAGLEAAVAENRPPLHETMVNLERLTGETSSRIEDLTVSLQATLGHLEDVGGNTSDLFEDQRPTIEEILLNLQETTRNLSEFSRTLADRPEALIRGKGAQGRKDGEAP